jgi:beta propeller repeat protein
LILGDTIYVRNCAFLLRFFQGCMHQSSQHNHRNDHTIILQSRSVRTLKPLVIGSKQEYFHSTRGSPLKPPPRILHVLNHAPPLRGYKAFTQDEFHNPEGENLLVRFGIDSIAGRMVARVLIAFMLFQPVYVALGMELEEAPSGDSVSVQSEETTASEAVEELQDTAENVTYSSEDQADTALEDAETNTDTVPEDGTASEATEGETEETTVGDETESVDVSMPDAGESDATDTSTDSGSGVSIDSDPSDSESTDGDSEDVASSSQDVASTTEDVASTTDDTVVVDTALTESSDNKYVFGEGDCTLVSEGEFYCVATGVERQVTGDSSVYAEKDREGDREIFYFDGVEVHRITNNSYDDFAPVFEEETLRIVWQAMVHDRLQIMVHDLSTNTTRQITSSRQNSSNPSIIGDIVVWQEWIDTNWEIMMTDVNNDGQAFEIERLTDNMVHDMFPAAYDGLVTWQSERGSSWEVVVYDMRTQKKQVLEKNENTKYENPRFALLFDSKHENGDVETIGYDLDTGEMTELGTKANPKPFVPVTPRDEVPDAIPQTAGSSTSITTKEDVDSGGDPVVE